ncbi:MAG: hypothetical protein AAF721_37015, partial [Myxococcota bacterium]
VELDEDGPGTPSPLVEFDALPDDTVWSFDGQFLVTRHCEASEEESHAKGACPGTIEVLSTETGERVPVANGIVTAPVVVPTP